MQMTPLHLAAQYDLTTIIDLLLNRNADIAAQNILGAKPLHMAALRGSVATVALLLNRGASINVEDNHRGTPLHCAAIYPGTADVISLLINAGASPGAKDNDGYTPLYLAAKHQHLEKAARLILVTAEDAATAKLLHNNFNPAELAAAIASHQ